MMFFRGTDFAIRFFAARRRFLPAAKDRSKTGGQHMRRESQNVKSRAQSGQVLPLMAISLAALLGFAGLAVDVGYLEYWQQQQQTVTDAAAVGGAQQLTRSSCSGSSAADSAASADASTNGFAAGGNVSVTPVSPPSTGPYAGNACAISVQITTQHVSTFFARLFGYPLGMSESTSAVAAAVSNGLGCIYLLNASTSSTFNGDNFEAPECGVLINDTATFTGDNPFEAAYIGYAGGAPTETGTTFTEATPAPMPPVSDPCPEILGCAYLTANPPSTSGCVSRSYTGGTTLDLLPGCYSSLTITGTTNVVLAGTYVFNGTATFNGVNSVTGSGVTLYVTGAGTPPTFNGIANLALSPPTTGSYPGVLYYQVSTNAAPPTFNGVSTSINGLIYAPDATNAIFNGTSGGYLVIVAGSATFNGSAAYDLATPPPGQSLVKEVVVAQ
jgi:hypothetical protein